MAEAEAAIDAFVKTELVEERNKNKEETRPRGLRSYK